MVRINTGYVSASRGPIVYNTANGRFWAWYPYEKMWVDLNNRTNVLIKPPKGNNREHLNIFGKIPNLRAKFNRAATTIQRHVRGVRQRARTGVHNPYTQVGYAALMKRIERHINSNKLTPSPRSASRSASSNRAKSRP